MKTQLFVLVQLVLAAMLMWTCFCRLVKTDADTHREVRWAIWFEGVAAGLVLGAPILPLMMPAEIHWKAGTTPNWVWLVLLTAVTMIQIVTARYWREGRVPEPFQQKGGSFALAVLLVLVGVMTSHGTAEAARTTPAQASPDGGPAAGMIAPGQQFVCMERDGCLVMNKALAELIEARLEACEKKNTL